MGTGSTFRKAKQSDMVAVAHLFEAIHTEEEEGRVQIGWMRGVYPTQGTAQNALRRDDLFVEEDEGEVVGTAIINQLQVDVYAKGQWQFPADDHEVMVLHTLVIDPQKAHRGYGKAFVRFYESYALDNGCRFLRMDTNARNKTARTMYHSLGYEEIGIAPTVFNGIPDVQLVLLEKAL